VRYGEGEAEPLGMHRAALNRQRRSVSQPGIGGSACRPGWADRAPASAELQMVMPP
jgi:hypothetical protein